MILTFAISFTAMFLPFTNLGLRTVTVRNISRNRTIAANYLGYVLVCRSFFYIIVAIIIVSYCNLFTYGFRTKTITYIFIAALNLFFNPFSLSFPQQKQ